MKNILFCLVLLVGVCVQAQTLKGKITDLQGNPIEYATIYISETKTGSITSEKGEFMLSLKQGTYTCIIQHLSYQTITKIVQIPQESPLEIRMEPKAIILREVKVSSKDEDRAYRIIRNTVAKSPYYQKQLLKYTATFYAKGTMKIKDVPRLATKILEKADKDVPPIRKGDIYTSEAINEVTVTLDKIEQKVISKRSSFPKNLEVGATGFDAYGSIYRSSGNGFISPVTRHGLSVYRYQLMYSYRDNDLLIHHIKVIPRNNNPHTYSGYIDIIDGSWHVYSLDLTGSMDLGIVSMKFNIKQNFVPIEKDVWMPGSSHEAIDAKAMGFSFIINYANSIRYKDYEVNPIMYSSNLASEMISPIQINDKQPVISKKSEKFTKEISEIMDKEKLTTRDAVKLVDLIESKNKEDQKNNPKNDSINPLEIQKRYFLTEDSNAANYDSTLWENYRTIPLLEEEAESFEQRRIKDSIQEEKKLAKLAEKGKDLKVVKKKTFSMGVNPMKSTLAFNTVEGFKVGINVYANKRFKDSVTNLKNELDFGYAFAAKHFFLYGSSQWNYNPKRFASLEVFGGKQDCDFKQQQQDGKYFFNSISSLFLRDNFIQYYDRIFAGVKHKTEVFNGFRTTVGLSYEQQYPLENRSDYSFFFRKTRDYKPNIPDNEYIMNNPTHISQQSTFLLDISVSYTPQMFYRYSENKKIKRYVRSKFPTFTLSWKKGINNVLGSNSHFDYLELNIAQDIDLKLFKTFKYSLSAGIFPNTKSIHFSQFKHFQKNSFWVTLNTFNNAFNTMPDYQYSTNEWFISGHAKYETLYLLLKFIPGLNKTLMTENLHLSFLTNPLTKNYLEVGYSLSKIFLMGNAGFFVGFDEFKSVNWSIRIGVSVF